MNTKDILKRLEQLFEYGKEALKTTHVYDRVDYINSDARDKFRSAVLTFIHKHFGENTPYYKEFEHATRGFSPSDLKRGIAILTTIKDEIEGGWLYSIKEIVSSEIFTDFIEMAEHLLAKNYKDPAAVIIGSVLEEHLRQLAIKNAIPILIEKDEKTVAIKANTLNAELYKKEIYNALDQKQINAWLDLRNKAAHGHYSEYSKDQVQMMLNGILDFILRTTR